MRLDSCPRRDTCSSKRGFSLIEVIVALTLLGLIATLLASGTRLTLDTSTRGSKKADSLRAKHTELAVLRSQVQGSLPFRYWTEGENRPVEHIAFEGRQDSIRFVSRYGLLDGPNSLPRWVELRLQGASSKTHKLVMEEHRILSPDNQPDDAPLANAELLECANGSFQYLDTLGERPQWLAVWSNIEELALLPAAVRIQCKTGTEPLTLLIPLEYSDSARLGMRLQ